MSKSTRFLTLAAFLSTSAFGVEPLVFKSIDSIGVDNLGGYLTMGGITADGQNQFLKLLIGGGENSALFRSCETSGRQMMLKPGMWQLTLNRSGERVVACTLAVAK